MNPGGADPFADDYALDRLQSIRPLGHDFEMLVTPRFVVTQGALAYEPMTAALFGALAEGATRLVDVGAHYGFFTLLAARHNPAIEIVALEPVAENFEVLDRNLRRHALDRARRLRAAASDRPGRAALHVSAASDNCSFYPHPSAPRRGTVEVETVTVDGLLAQCEPGPLLVKIDTDGHELAVLAGMAETFARFPDLRLIVELNPKMQRQAGHSPEALLHALEDAGLAVFFVDEGRRRVTRPRRIADWRALMADPASYVNLYCVRRERALSVCFFAHSAGLAGGERSLLELAAELVRDHGAVATVVLPEAGPLEERLRRAGAVTLRLPAATWCPFESDGAFPPPAADGRAGLAEGARELVGGPLADLATVHPHVVVSHTLATPWGALAAPLLGVPHVWHVCEFGDELEFTVPFEEVLEVVDGVSARLFFAARAVRERLFPAMPAERGPTLYRYLDIPPPVSPPPPHGRSAGAVRIGVFATLTPNKGQDLAIRAVAELVRRGHDVELLLAGLASGPYQRELEALVAAEGLGDRVRFAGLLADPYPAMRASDVVLVASRREAFGRSAAEAMLLGRAIVYSAVGGLGEYLTDGVTGLAFPPGDLAAAVARLEELVADPGRRQALGDEARRQAQARFSRDGYGGQAYRALLELRGGAAAPLPSLFVDVLSRLAAGWTSPGAQGREVAESLRRRNEEIAEEKRRLGEQLAEAQRHRVELETIRDGLTAGLERLQAENRRLGDENRAIAARAGEVGALCDRLKVDLDRTVDTLRALEASRPVRIAKRLRKIVGG